MKMYKIENRDYIVKISLKLVFSPHYQISLIIIIIKSLIADKVKFKLENHIKDSFSFFHQVNSVFEARSFKIEKKESNRLLKS